MNAPGPHSYVTCRVGELLVGIPLGRIQEINRLVDATFVPRVPRTVKGLINLRGNLVTVLDLVRILHDRDAVVGRDSRNVIVDYEGERLGLIVDAVGDVATCDGLPIEPLPSHLEPAQARWFEGLVQYERGILLVLSVDAVLLAQGVAEASA